MKVASITALLLTAAAVASANDTPENYSPIELLLKLYDDTRGFHWTNHTQWLVDDDYCDGCCHEGDLNGQIQAIVLVYTYRYACFSFFRDFVTW